MANVGGLSGPITVNPDPVAPGALPNVTGVNPIGASDSAAQQYQAGLQSALTALQQRANAPNMFNVAAGFLTPGPGGFFGELGHASQALAQWQEQQRQMQIPIANLKIQMAVNRLAQDKAQGAQAVLGNPIVAQRMQQDPVFAANMDAYLAQMGSKFATPNEVQNAAQSGATTAASLPGAIANTVNASIGAANTAAAQGQTPTANALVQGANTVSGAQTPPSAAPAASANPANTMPVGQTPTGNSSSAQSVNAIPMGSAVHVLTQIEGGGALNPPANAASSAIGSGQMISSTLNSVAKQLGVDPSLYGKDPSITAQMNGTLFTDNAQFLASHGVPNTMGWNRMAWLLGAPAAAKAAHSPTDAPLSTVVSPAAMHANGWQPNMTVGDLLAQEASKVQSTGVDPNAPVAVPWNSSKSPSGASSSPSVQGAVQNTTAPSAATGQPNLVQLAQNPNADPAVLSQALPHNYTTPFTSSLNLSQIPQTTLDSLAQSGSVFPYKIGVDKGAATVSQTNAANTLAAYNTFNQQGGLSAVTPNLTAFLKDAANPAFAAKIKQVVGAINNIPGGLQGLVRSIQGAVAKGVHVDPQQLASKYGIDPSNAGVFNETVLALAQNNLLEAKMRTVGNGNMTRPMADVGTADLPTMNTNPRELIATMARTYNNAERYTALASAYQMTAPSLANVGGYQNLAPAATFLSSKLAAAINHFYDRENGAYAAVSSSATQAPATPASKNPQKRIAPSTTPRTPGIPWLNQ